MTLELFLTPQAQSDTSAICSYTLETWGRPQAIEYLTGLDAAIDLLRDFPRMASLERAFSPPVRVRTYRAHVIVYQFNETRLTVIRILNARSDWMAALSQ